MNGIYLIIGGNIGNRIKNLDQCVFEIEKNIGKIDVKSSIFETASWGKEDEYPYLNQVLFLYASLKPFQLLKACLDIEKKLGRIRAHKWEARIIDVDILFFNRQILHTDNLIIPHPFIQQRKFVLVPMCELAPNYIHPILQKSMRQLLDECKDTLEVHLFQP